MSTLPIEKICNLDCFRYEGVLIPTEFVSQANMDAMKTFEVREDDVWVVSYPRTGSHWVKNIIYNIVHCKEPEVPLPVDDLVPFVETFEFSTGQSRYEQLAAVSRSERRIMGTHLQASVLPQQLFDKKGKIIFILRNPKDAALSLYHFLALEEDATFTEFAENILDGEVMFGSYVDFILSWWEKKDLCDFCLLNFEDLKKDMDSNIRNLAVELGVTLSDSDVETVKARCSMEAMKKKGEEMRKAGKIIKSRNVYRKGVSGGWKSAFTVAMSEKYDKHFADKLGHLNIKFT